MNCGTSENNASLIYLNKFSNTGKASNKEQNRSVLNLIQTLSMLTNKEKPSFRLD
jgi:hypothetical protein